MIAGGARPRRSSRQAAPDRPSQASTPSTGWRVTAKATGAATHRLTQLKQSSRRPQRPLPSATRRRSTASHGPSSCASRCATRQVANTPSTNLNQSSSTRSVHDRQVAYFLPWWIRESAEMLRATALLVPALHCGQGRAAVITAQRALSRTSRKSQ